VVLLVEEALRREDVELEPVEKGDVHQYHRPVEE
jgi:hypothetical protein